MGRAKRRQAGGPAWPAGPTAFWLPARPKPRAVPWVARAAVVLYPAADEVEQPGSMVRRQAAFAGQSRPASDDGRRRSRHSPAGLGTQGRGHAWAGWPRSTSPKRPLPVGAVRTFRALPAFAYVAYGCPDARFLAFRPPSSWAGPKRGHPGGPALGRGSHGDGGGPDNHPRILRKSQTIFGAVTRKARNTTFLNTAES